MRLSRQKTGLRWAVAAAVLLALTLGCSTDSPTAPVQEPPGPPSPPSATWNITVTVDPSRLTAGSPEPSTVDVRVRRASDGTVPPAGTTMVVSTSLGDLISQGSGFASAVVTLVNGRANVLLFAGSVTGTALVSAQLESSVGQRAVPILAAIEPVVASFVFQNTNANFSVAFRNTSTGDPTSFLWDFGDGATSTEENPTHLFPAGGDFVVVLTASKPGSSDTASDIVAVLEEPIEEIVADFVATIDGLTVVFQDTSFGDPTSWRWSFGDGVTSGQQNPVHTYRQAGSYVVTLEARKSGSSDATNQTITVDRTLFIRLITPTTGPPGGGTPVTIDGQGFVGQLRVFFGSKLANVASQSGNRLLVTSPPVDPPAPTVTCDDNNDGTVGVRTLDTPVNVTVELATGGLQTVANGFSYLTGSPTCVGD